MFACVRICTCSEYESRTRFSSMQPTPFGYYTTFLRALQSLRIILLHFLKFLLHLLHQTRRRDHLDPWALGEQVHENASAMVDLRLDDAERTVFLHDFCGGKPVQDCLHGWAGKGKPDLLCLAGEHELVFSRRSPSSKSYSRSRWNCSRWGGERGCKLFKKI